MSKAFTIALLALTACSRRPPPAIPNQATPWCVSALLRDDAMVVDDDNLGDVVRVCVTTSRICRHSARRGRSLEGRLVGIRAVGECEELHAQP